MSIEELKAEVARLKAEVDNLRKNAEINTPQSPHEVARLKAEVERLTAFTTRTIIPNEELQAQVERLTKAGDWMFNAIILNSDKHVGEGMDAWISAKKRNPSA